MPNKNESSVWKKTCILLKSESSHFFCLTSWIIRVPTSFNVLGIFFVQIIKAYFSMQKKRHRLLLCICCNILFKYIWVSTNCQGTSHGVVECKKNFCLDWLSLYPGFQTKRFKLFLQFSSFKKYNNLYHYIFWLLKRHMKSYVYVYVYTYAYIYSYLITNLYVYSFTQKLYVRES